MKENLQRTWLEVDLDNLLHNYRVLRGRLRGDVRFLGVVKANAYGCGAGNYNIHPSIRINI